MAQRKVYIPGIERWVTLGQYVKAVKSAMANPDGEFKTTLCQWWPGTGQQICAEFRQSLHDRINQAMPYLQRGQHNFKVASTGYWKVGPTVNNH